jgi:hypothetical protein
MIVALRITLLHPHDHLCIAAHTRRKWRPALRAQGRVNGSRRRTARKQKHPDALETHAARWKMQREEKGGRLLLAWMSVLRPLQPAHVKQEDIRDFCFFPLKSHTKLSRAA